MKITSDKFRKWPHKAVTLLGMSGVGKTTLANKLDKKSWFHYSGDYRIGTKYLEEPILDNIKEKAMQESFLADLLRSDSIYICSNITVNNLEPVSTFLGKLGNPEQGGLPYQEFVRRQRLHREAEINAMLDVPDFINKAKNIYKYPHFLNDAGGSICELDDPRVFETLSQHTVIVYIRADEKHEEMLCQRAVVSPKPLYFEDLFLEKNIRNFLEETGETDINKADPNQFASWVFPKLLAHRKPKYEQLARDYGYTVDLGQLEAVRDEADFIDLVSNAMNVKQDNG